MEKIFPVAPFSKIPIRKPPRISNSVQNTLSVGTVENGNNFVDLTAGDYDICIGNADG